MAVKSALYVLFTQAFDPKGASLTLLGDAGLH